MRKIYTLLMIMLVAMGATAQSTSNLRLVVKTNDGAIAKYKLSDVAELTFEPDSVAPDGKCVVTRFDNLSPSYISVSGLAVGDQLTAGETATVTITPGSVLSSGIGKAHYQHFHLHVNDQVIVPATPDDQSGYVQSVDIPFTVPEGECSIVACYSVQQQTSSTGYTMTLEDNPAVKLYGVSPNERYKYFDAYLQVNEAYVIDNVEYKMGDGEWAPVKGSAGCDFYAAELNDLYRVKIRPGQKNVTGDVTLRVSGTQHHRYSITWNNATAQYIDLERSTLPAKAIDADTVVAELYVNDGYYLKGASLSDGSEVKTSKYYVKFAMPATDVTVNLDIRAKVPVSYTVSEHVANAKFYDQPDMFYGVETAVGVPGEEVYLFASAESGYKPQTASTDDGHTFSFVHYADNIYYCPITITEGAASMTATIQCIKAYSASSEQVVVFTGGNLFAEGETVNMAIQIPSGKEIKSVKVLTEGGDEVPYTLNGAYGSFVMPAANVTVTVTYADLSTEDKVNVIAYYDEEQYRVSSSTNYDWKFAKGFQIDKGTTFYLQVLDYYGENFYVGVKNGETVTVYPAVMDEDSGEYSFGKAITATGDVTIKVGATKASVAF